MTFPTPHLEKLHATHANDKLPARDKPRIEAAIARYEQWISDIAAVEGDGSQQLARMIELLNEYRNYIDIDLVFDSPGVCQGSCRVSHFLSGLFILSLRVQIYRPDGCPIACAA